SASDAAQSRRSRRAPWRSVSRKARSAWRCRSTVVRVAAIRAGTVPTTVSASSRAAQLAAKNAAGMLSARTSRLGYWAPMSGRAGRSAPAADAGAERVMAASLDAGADEAIDEVLLEDGEQDDHGHGGDRGAGHEQVEVGPGLLPEHGQSQ